MLNLAKQNYILFFDNDYPIDTSRPMQTLDKARLVAVEWCIRRNYHGVVYVCANDDKVSIVGRIDLRPISRAYSWFWTPSDDSIGRVINWHNGKLGPTESEFRKVMDAYVFGVN